MANDIGGRLFTAGWVTGAKDWKRECVSLGTQLKNFGTITLTHSTTT